MTQLAVAESRPSVLTLQAFSALTNRSVLVTGGTGSFGKAFVQRALAVNAKRVTVFSRDELKQSEMQASLNDERLRFLIGSVADRERMARALHGVDFVIHAAAMKQVPACELHPWEANNTNVLGTQAVADAAIQAGVELAVFLSTDKAVEPNTLYGSTKLTAERLWNRSNVYAGARRTRFCATRYGNVIGSRGSVVPLFREQAETGQLTITDRRMSRFWMRLPEAVALVELALAKGRGGEVFVPKAPSCGILTVAEAVAPGVPWVETGIRRGEKLHETLVSEHEARDTHDMGSHYVIEPERTWEFVRPLSAPRVPEGWSYKSDTNEWRLTVDEMRGLVS